MSRLAACLFVVCVAVFAVAIQNDLVVYAALALFAVWIIAECVYRIRRDIETMRHARYIAESYRDGEP